MTLVINDPTDFLTEQEDSDRRRGLRIRDSRPVKVLDPGSMRIVGGETRDISTTGLCIELPIFASVRPGKVINVHVGLDGSGHSLANRKQMIPAKVVWVTRGERLTAGVEFLPAIAAHLDAA